VAFLNMAAPLAEKAGVTIVAEPLNKGECNIINTVGEAMEYVREVSHPGFKCLVDSYHFWLEEEPLGNLEAAMADIHHVHVADKVGRVAPGESGQSDYGPFFAVLKAGGYDGLCSIEGKVAWDDPEALSRYCNYLHEAWDEA
ncbi:MAG: sugar phosphate isomerase/epimerase family protein, partial [Phycisphaerae bacterium]